MRVSRPALTIATLVLAAWVAAWAQPAGKIPRLGLLMPGQPGLGTSQRAMEALQQGLPDLAWVEGQTIAFETRWDEGRPERWPELAGDLVRRQVDVIFAGTTSGALAARGLLKKATRADPTDCPLASQQERGPSVRPRWPTAPSPRAPC